jgi:hypothetical protein
MKYYDEMTEKYGFNGGESEPAEARDCRYVYVMALNAAAKRLGSDVRAVAYDRPGMHNGCMITGVPAHLVSEAEPSALADGSWMESSRNYERVLVAAELYLYDDAWYETVATVVDEYVDDLVVATVTIDQSGLDETLSRLEGI